jgi:DNA mismatch endonuclease (patch repair protein)
MQGNRAKGTKPELALVDALKRHGIRRFLSNAAELPGRPDIAFPPNKLAVFVHGCFWHRCPRHTSSLPKSNREYWELKFRLNKERDKRKLRELKGIGWRALVVWECEIREDVAACVERIQSAISSRTVLRPTIVKIISKEMFP